MAATAGATGGDVNEIDAFDISFVTEDTVDPPAPDISAFKTTILPVSFPFVFMVIALLIFSDPPVEEATKALTVVSNCPIKTCFPLLS